MDKWSAVLASLKKSIKPFTQKNIAKCVFESPIME